MSHEIQQNTYSSPHAGIISKELQQPAHPPTHAGIMNQEHNDAYIHLLILVQ
jgi:hypothetical protein